MRRQPQIRFAGFTDDWEQYKLGDIADRYDNLRIPITAVNRVPGNTPYYGANGIQDYVDGYTHEGEYILIAEDGANDLKNYPVQYVSGRVWVNNHAHVLQGKSKIADNKFLKYYISQANIEPFLVGSSRAKLNAEVMMKIEIYLPINIKEQQKIGKFLSQLDNLITLYQRKYDKLLNFKKAMLEKMFPRAGKNEPGIRFGGFISAWEQCKLGDVAEFNPTAVLPDSFEYVDLESVSGAEMITHRTETKATAPSRAQRLAQSGDLFYQMVRPYQKNNYLFEKIDGKYVFSTGYAQLRPTINGYFLLTLVQLDQFVKDVLDKCTGTSYPAISAKNLADIDINIPSKSTESNQIGKFFCKLDDLIILQHHKLEKLQNIKKSLLEKMFV